MHCITHTLGFPRIGINRELKKAVEGYWKGKTSETELLAQAKALRLKHWSLQHVQGVDLLPVGDFSLYDHILDAAMMVGAVPERFSGNDSGLDTYFRMARGDAGRGGAKAMEMTKWFDTNYHYIVPEFYADQAFTPSSARLLAQLEEAREAGFQAKAVLPGPLTFLTLGKSVEPGFDRWRHAEALSEAYASIITDIKGHCEWLQLDEPILALDLEPHVLELFQPVYERLAEASGNTKLMLATYFGPVDHNADVIRRLPVNALHLDLVRGPDQLRCFLKDIPDAMALSLGVVNGRNIWAAYMDQSLEQVNRAVKALGAERVMIAPSCSLLHVPMDVELERELEPKIKDRMAFAVQKCAELETIAKAARGEDVDEALKANRMMLAAGRSDPERFKGEVRKRLAEVDEGMLMRSVSFEKRRHIQQQALELPYLPTTTIGSYPQTPDIRKARRQFKNGEMNAGEYKERMHGFIREVVERQLDLGLDVLVHGEPERNDMVEYFGEQLEGFCFTSNGWVQSYGSRCVKPPVIYGDVQRIRPMTLDWISYAQALTDKPVKGMLTGPVTILCWSFVRDDQPRSETCMQIALAILDEVLDLEKGGTTIIQIDEPALREGLPLRKEDWNEYLEWAVACFRLATSSVHDETQIHTHMCYADFNDIIEWIARMDADVISIEASRSAMALLEAFERFEYPNEIGPGVYDIHSPRVPPVDEMAGLLHEAARHIDPRRLWVNPDCGLKTREWPEVLAALANMVQAAETARKELMDA